MRLKGYLTLLVGLCIGVIAIAVICHFVGIGKIWEKVAAVGPIAFILFFVNFSIVLLLQLKAWQIVLKAYGFKIKFRDMCIAMCMSQSGNFLTPSAYIGGEVLRIFFLSKRYGIKKRLLIASVFIVKFQEFSAFLAAIVISSVEVYIHYFTLLPIGVKLGLLLFNAFLFGAFIFMQISILKGRQVIHSLLRKVASFGIWSHKLTKLAFYAGETEKLVHRLFKEHPRAAIKSYALIGFSMVLIFSKPLIFFIFLTRGIPFNFPELSLIFVLTQATLALQFTPGGFGILEGGQIGTYAIIGYSPAEAMAYLSSMRLSDLFYVALGLIFIANYGLTFLLGKKSNDDKDTTN